MKRFLRWLWKEIVSVVPVFVFFFFAFSLINFTQKLMLHKEGITGFDYLTILLGSAVVAKVLLIVDHMSFTEMFKGRPLIYNVSWKTFLYGTACLLVRFFDRTFPLIRKQKSVELGIREFVEVVNWPQFWAIQIWFFILFFIFVCGRDLSKKIGHEKMRRIFFG